MAFAVSLWFSILTQFVILFLSVSRLMIVIHPINTIFRKIKFVVKSVFIMYFISFLAAFMATLILKFNYKSLTISLCLPFIDSTNSFTMIKVITWFIVITQAATSIVIMVMHVLLVTTCKKSSESLKIQHS